jgi:hypothetical protein
MLSIEPSLKTLEQDELRDSARATIHSYPNSSSLMYLSSGNKATVMLTRPVEMSWHGPARRAAMRTENSL